MWLQVRSKSVSPKLCFHTLQVGVLEGSLFTRPTVYAGAPAHPFTGKSKSPLLGQRRSVLTPATASWMIIVLRATINFDKHSRSTYWYYIAKIFMCLFGEGSTISSPNSNSSLFAAICCRDLHFEVLVAVPALASNLPQQVWAY